MEAGASSQASGPTPMPRAKRCTPCMSPGRASQRSRLPEGSAVAATESTRRRLVVRTHTRRARAAAHVRELPQRLASVCLGCRVVLGDDGLALYAAGQIVERRAPLFSRSWTVAELFNKFDFLFVAAVHVATVRRPRRL